MAPIKGNFKGKHILSVAQFAKSDIELIFMEAERLRKVVEHQGTTNILQNKILAVLFYEPSTRTSSSFLAAMQRLGGGIIPINGVQYSSVTKGENLEDTITTLNSYADVIALRHPEVGAASRAADVSGVPIINAGDGIGEHPTQALLDLFTIREELGRIEGLRVTLLGDLKYGRTVHSLAHLLPDYGASVNYVSPPQLKMPTELVKDLKKQGLKQSEHERLEDVLAQTDVLYVTRVQKERFEHVADYESVKDIYEITPELMKKAPKKMIVMHPLPRNDEIDARIDTDPRAAYFRQMRYGMYVRMALLALVLGRQ